MAEKPQVRPMLIEITAGTMSIGFRVGGSRPVQIFKGWENLEPAEAVSILARIRKGEITAEDLAARGFKQVELSDELLEKLEGTRHE